MHFHDAFVFPILNIIVFIFRYLRFDSLDHRGEFDFALLLCFGVDVEFLAFAIQQSWEEAAFPEVVIALIPASGAGFAYLSRSRLRMQLCGRTRGVYRQFYRVFYRNHLRICVVDFLFIQLIETLILPLPPNELIYQFIWR